MGLIKNMVAVYKFAKAGGDWNTGEVRGPSKPAEKQAAQPEEAAQPKKAEAPAGWRAKAAVKRSRA